MSDDNASLESALVATDAEWTHADTERGLRLLRRRVQRRRRARLAALGGGALVLTAAAALMLQLSQKAAPPFAIAGGPLRFADGSSVTPLEPSTVVSVGDARPERIALVLERGHATFEVTPNPRRVFRAEAGAVSVEALGTAFAIERRGQLVGVSVQRGRVRVAWPKGSQELGVGESGWFPPPAVATGSDKPSARPADPSPGALNPPEAVSVPGGSNPPEAASARSDWRALAARGSHADAYRLLRDPGVKVAGADELLLAADVARLSGHPSDAAEYLERFLREHGSDVRAPVSAFSLGHLLMNRLGRPAQAAGRFAEARRGARGDAIAEDSLAREVEAWSRAGNSARAKQLAEEYLKLYPSGQRAKAVRAFGGLD